MALPVQLRARGVRAMKAAPRSTAGRWLFAYIAAIIATVPARLLEAQDLAGEPDRRDRPVPSEASNNAPAERYGVVVVPVVAYFPEAGMVAGDRDGFLGHLLGSGQMVSGWAAYNITRPPPRQPQSVVKEKARALPPVRLIPRPHGSSIARPLSHTYQAYSG